MLKRTVVSIRSASAARWRECSIVPRWAPDNSNEPPPVLLVLQRVDTERPHFLSHFFERARQTSRWILGSMLGASLLAGTGCSERDDWRFGPRPRSRGDGVHVVYDRDI